MRKSRPDDGELKQIWPKRGVPWEGKKNWVLVPHLLHQGQLLLLTWWIFSPASPRIQGVQTTGISQSLYFTGTLSVASGKKVLLWWPWLLTRCSSELQSRKYKVSHWNFRNNDMWDHFCFSFLFPNSYIFLLWTQKHRPWFSVCTGSWRMTPNSCGTFCPWAGTSSMPL